MKNDGVMNYHCSSLSRFSFLLFSFRNFIISKNSLYKGKEKKRIYIAPFISKRSGMDHTVFTCKYTMPAFPSYAFTRWRHP